MLKPEPERTALLSMTMEIDATQYARIGGTSRQFTSEHPKKPAVRHEHTARFDRRRRLLVLLLLPQQRLPDLLLGASSFLLVAHQWTSRFCRFVQICERPSRRDTVRKWTRRAPFEWCLRARHGCGAPICLCREYRDLVRVTEGTFGCSIAPRVTV